jgi:hypothetical protein
MLPRVDANLGKSFRVSESKSLQVRVDAYNVTNHPLAATPTLSINGTASTAFGTINNKTSSRRFQGSLRLSF